MKNMARQIANLMVTPLRAPLHSMVVKPYLQMLTDRSQMCYLHRGVRLSAQYVIFYCLFLFLTRPAEVIRASHSTVTPSWSVISCHSGSWYASAGSHSLPRVLERELKFWLAGPTIWYTESDRAGGASVGAAQSAMARNTAVVISITSLSHWSVSKDSPRGEPHDYNSIYGQMINCAWMARVSTCAGGSFLLGEGKTGGCKHCSEFWEPLLMIFFWPLVRARAARSEPTGLWEWLEGTFGSSTGTSRASTSTPWKQRPVIYTGEWCVFRLGDQILVWVTVPVESVSWTKRMPTKITAGTAQ